jgi:hypothetical protein
MCPDRAWQRLWLCVPPITLCAFDGCMTLWGQPAAYWADLKTREPVLAEVARQLHS